MVVSQRREFNKDLTYDTNLRLLNIKTLQIIKITDNPAWTYKGNFAHRLPDKLLF